MRRLFIEAITLTFPIDRLGAARGRDQTSGQHRPPQRHAWTPLEADGPRFRNEH